MAPLTVHDTCIWVAGEVRRGEPWRCLEVARQGRVTLACCKEMIAELANVLYRVPFLYTVDEVRAVVYEYRHLANQVDITGTLHVVEADPDDDKIVECAVVTGAPTIVTRNYHLLNLVEYQGVNILTPTLFLERLANDQH